MNDADRTTTAATDFRVKAALGISLTALILIAPFSINSFVQGRYLTGILSLFVVAALLSIASLSSRGRYLPVFTFATFVPSVIATIYLGIPEQGIIAALWAYPAVLVFYVMLLERYAWLANIALMGVLLPRVWSVLEFPLVARYIATLLGVSIVSIIFVRVISNQQRKLEWQAVTDPLTGLANRLTLHGTLDHAVQQSRRNRTPMTLLTLDLDHFKSINDTLGHDSGDLVLRGVSHLLSRRIRRADHVFRTGGEEFLILLQETNIEQGRQVAEELREAIESEELLPGKQVTVSIGVATLASGENWMEWMKRSDDNLYRAKTEGRNRVAS